MTNLFHLKRVVDSEATSKLNGKECDWLVMSVMNTEVDRSSIWAIYLLFLTFLSSWQDNLTLIHAFQKWKMQLAGQGWHRGPGEWVRVTFICCPCCPPAPPALWAGDSADEADAPEGPRGPGGGAGGRASVLPEAGMWAANTPMPWGPFP